MKKILRLSVHSFRFKAFIVFLLLFVNAASYAMGFCFQPYAGVDGQFRLMSFRKEFGDKNFRNRYPQANVYVGFKFCENLGIEGGYFSTVNLSRNSFFEENEPNLGVRTNATLGNVSESQVRGWHINAVGFMPLYEVYCLTGIAYIGLSQTTIALRTNLTLFDGAPPPEPITSNLIQTRTILRAGIGIQHMISKCFGIRGLLGWENTSKFSAIGTLNHGGGSNAIAKAKDSVVFSFGLFSIY